MTAKGQNAPVQRGARVAMISSVHRWNDTRIYLKEAASLVQAGYDVVLAAVATERAGPFEASGVRVRALRRRPRVLRWINWLAILRIVIAERATIVHAHDPELFPLALLLKLAGCKAICDVHEDLPQQVLHKEWIPGWFRGRLSSTIGFAQKRLPQIADAVILAEDSYRRSFPPAPNVSVVRNFPLLSRSSKGDYHTESLRLVYVGDVRRVRGIVEYVSVTAQLAKRGLPVELRVIGSFADPVEEAHVRSLMRELKVESKIVLLGRRPPEEIPHLLEECDIGLALLHPIGNYRESYPTKMFEYMAVGLPVVASHFALWKDILVGHDCGRVIDPLSVDETTAVIVEYWNSPELRERHGRNGRRAVLEHYHWERELGQLLTVYSGLTRAETSTAVRQ